MPDIDVIIVGYGSAGKRHEKAARSRNMSVVTVDPDHTRKALMFDYEHAFRAFKPQMVVVATPPDNHLEIIEAALEVTPYVLCEKPLCGHGQLDWAKAIVETYPNQRVNVAYNYRYHAGIRTFLESGLEFYNFNMICEQHRKVKPSWGYLLDHVSHDVDIMRMLIGDGVELTGAEHVYGSDSTVWSAGFRSQNQFFTISDSVTRDEVERVAGIHCHNSGEKDGFFINIDADPMMYELMWDDFVVASDTGGEVDIPMQDAIVTQEILDRIYGEAHHEFAE